MIRICLALWAALAALPARAEETQQYRTVAGTFAVVPTYFSNSQRRFVYGADLVLNGQAVAHDDSWFVDLYALFRNPGEPPEAPYNRAVIVETGSNICDGTWQVVEFRTDGTAVLSEKFDVCVGTDPNIDQSANGTLVFTFSYDDDNDVGIAPDVYLYRDTIFRQAATVAAVPRRFPTAAGMLEAFGRSGQDGSHQVELVLNGGIIAEGEGREVELQAAFPDPKQPRLLLLAFEPWAKSCYASWMILEVAPDQQPRATPTFAECRQPPEIVQLKRGGLLLYFADGDPYKPDTFLYADHRIRSFKRKRMP
jgi:hypothetical protein